MPPVTRKSDAPRTLFAKIWDTHAIETLETGESLLWIDRHLVHEGSRTGFDRLDSQGLTVHRPNLTFGMADHYVPTDIAQRHLIMNGRTREMLDLFDRNTSRHGIRAFGFGDPDQGIVHVVGPEQAITLPGLTLVCGDSHTSTHGALGALAFGIGASEVAHVLATQTLWQKRPRTMRITVEGRLQPGVSAKDLILAIIARIGANGAAGHVIEYAGPAVRALSVEARLTLCNMAIEAGAKAGLVAPDETTIAYLRGRPTAPVGAQFDQAAAYWLGLATDPDAPFDREVVLDGDRVPPMVTWGTSPALAVGVDGVVPDPSLPANRAQAPAMHAALDYMGLVAGTPIQSIAIDRVFIGSCTNARIEDLRAAADIARLGPAAVPAMISPGSTRVKAEAEAEGLDRVFRAAGYDWEASGCSLCVGLNGDVVAAGQRCASTSNRNFVGRQGPGARTHLVSPAMAAAAALTGRFTDVRTLV